MYHFLVNYYNSQGDRLFDDSYATLEEAIANCNRFERFGAYVQDSKTNEKVYEIKGSQKHEILLGDY